MDCSIEWDEWIMVAALVTPAHAVMELGSRFGTTSCALSKATNNSGRVVAVEPDRGAIRFAEANRAIHHCNFALVAGSVSSEPQRVHAGSGYDLRTRAALSNESQLAVPHLTFRELEAKLGWRIDTLLIDCEACIGSLLTPQHAHDVLSGVRLILMEHDLPQELHGGYSKYFGLLRAAGFEQIWLSQDTFAPGNPWSRLLKHSAWQRVRRGSRREAAAALSVAERDEAARELARLRTSCAAYATRMQYTPKQLNCLDASLDDPIGWHVNAEAHAGQTDRAIEVALKRSIGNCSKQSRHCALPVGLPVPPD